ncbi:uncharacterized protein LOC132202829 [Neocloeon triangulifer]|uniref:uncharacterized protein LOC132202829 n=1 Tax=Neocloeon triangulifer TaxID=2078957 RepID=UPI00286F82AE|nr:uncharacterized protein LOC132202829 [Neocloeon triangulifer]
MHPSGTTTGSPAAAAAAAGSVCRSGSAAGRWHGKMTPTRVLLGLLCCVGPTLQVLVVTAGSQERQPAASTELVPPTPIVQDNSSGVGQLLGDGCDKSCSPNLQGVYCDKETHTCECEKTHPVRLSPTVGCAKPVRLGEQCFHDRTCSFSELHSACIQIHHNAICQCKPGFHIVALNKPRERVFCSEDIIVIRTDLHTLFGMAAGIAVITGLICFVLRLYSRARYSPPRHYANAGLPPPILFASETGIPLAVQRAPSRSSGRHSAPPFSRRASSSLGLIGGGHSSSSRAGSRRPSTASYNSSSSSVRSYGVRRLEEENERKYQRQLMKMKQQPNQQPLLNLQKGSSGNLISSSLGSGSFCTGSFERGSFSASCRTPLSTDDLLPSVRELVEPVSQPGSSGSQHKTRTTSLQPIIAPSSSSENSPVDDKPLRFFDDISPSSPLP